MFPRKGDWSAEDQDHYCRGSKHNNMDLSSAVQKHVKAAVTNWYETELQLRGQEWKRLKAAGTTTTTTPHHTHLQNSEMGGVNWVFPCRQDKLVSEGETTLHDRWIMTPNKTFWRWGNGIFFNMISTQQRFSVSGDKTESKDPQTSQWNWRYSV